MWYFSLLQFALTAPTGMIAAKSFQEMFADLMALTHGAETVPDAWLNVNGDKVDNTLFFPQVHLYVEQNELNATSIPSGFLGINIASTIEIDKHQRKSCFHSVK